MECYIVLSGGYFGISHKQDMGGYQVNKGEGEQFAPADYAIMIKGLPDNFLQPAEVERRYRYFCETCKRWIKEVEVEQKAGCYMDRNHRVRMEYMDREIWESAAYECYKPTRASWMKPCYRITVSNEKGLQKWRDIWRYATATYPATQRLVPDKLPVPVGNRHEWTLQLEQVPVIDLSASYKPEAAQAPIESEWKNAEFNRPTEEATKEAEERLKEKKKIKYVKGAQKALIQCDICGQSFRGKNGIRFHKMHKHKEAVNV